MRYYYYVAATADPQLWEVRSSLHPSVQACATREAALATARQLCRRQWEEQGTPCGVRVQNSAGEWVDESLLGDG